jgi:hypothetical protein
MIKMGRTVIEVALQSAMVVPHGLQCSNFNLGSASTSLVQEYMNLNKPVLVHIVKMGGDSATVSDAARAWLEIKAHYEGLSRNAMARISTTPAESLPQVQASVAKRAGDGLTEPHYLALFLDPRPSMHAVVQHSGLLGSAADKTLGTTEAFNIARAALKSMSAAVHVTGKSKDEVGKASWIATTHACCMCVVCMLTLL